MITQPPRGGSQEIIEPDFDTSALQIILGGDIGSFLLFLERLVENKGIIKDMQIAGDKSYRLGQFTTNRSRIGKIFKERLPGVRHVATDYAANAYQTFVTSRTLEIMQHVAYKVNLSNKPYEEVEDGGYTRAYPETPNCERIKGTFDKINENNFKAIFGGLETVPKSVRDIDLSECKVTISSPTFEHKSHKEPKEPKKYKPYKKDPKNPGNI